MNAPQRQFTDEPATRRGHTTALIIGITAPSGGGKTYSALELATGIQRVTGGEIFGIDTEAKRMLHYADYFNFRHVPMEAPYSPLDYLAAIEHCVRRNARIIIIDQLTNEHDGEGGVLDQIDEFLDRKSADDPDKRSKYMMLANVVPKKQRRKLNKRIVQLGDKVIFILLYRAEEKIKPKRSGGEPDKLGWQPITTSKLPYDMTVRFLLPPGSDGVPTLIPAEPAEKLVIKNPEQFKGWFKPGERLSQEMGQRLAEWASGSGGGSDFEVMVESYDNCRSMEEFEKLEAERAKIWDRKSPVKPRVKLARDQSLKRLQTPSSDDDWIAKFRGTTASRDLTPLWQDCIVKYNGGVPLPVEDAYNIKRETLLEQEGKVE